MIHLLAALICGLISLLYFSLSIECLCKLSPRFKKLVGEVTPHVHREHHVPWTTSFAHRIAGGLL